MALPYPGTNPTQEWANQLVDLVNAAAAGAYTMWSGTLAVAKPLSAGNFYSVRCDKLAEHTGPVGSPDMPLTWTNDCFSVPQSGHYEIIFQPGFGSVDTGNRMVGIVKNPTATTWSSGTDPGMIRMLKTAPTTDTTAGIGIWKGYLSATDKIMCLVRSTIAVSVVAGARDTILTVEFKRSAR